MVEKFEKWFNEQSIANEIKKNLGATSLQSLWKGQAAKKQDEGKIDSNQLMSNDEMLWASPSVILDYLQRLGTLQG